ncbi:MAG: inositol monophosphatase family protein [Methylophagaceae bacterium]
MEIDLKQLTDIIVTASKDELLPRFNRVKCDYKMDGSIVTDADIAMQNRLSNMLQQAYPDIALLGEEMSAEQQQELLLSGKALWCVDPIDGTSNFAAGIPYYSVSLALINNGQITHGLVYDPMRDECFTAEMGQGAWLNNQPLTLQKTNLSLNKTIALIDFKRLSNQLATQLMTVSPYASQRSFGSIALELCWLAAGRGHIYLHGKQQLWDYAAAQLILSEAGAFACTLEGELLISPTLVPRSTLAAVDKDLFDQWQAYLRTT